MIILSLSGCSSLKESVDNDQLDQVYMIAKKKLQDGNWKQAIIKLKEIDKKYPICSYSQQIQIDLIYAYYKNSDPLLSQVTIDRFIRMNPTHPNIDYVIYIRGLTNMNLDHNDLQEFFGIDRSDRDPRYAYAAFNDFSRLIHCYPKSLYYKNAMKYLVFLKNRLAKYEYSIAHYYAQRGAWIAVVNRIEGMLRDYPDTQATRDGLKLMKIAYSRMEMTEQVKKVENLSILTNRRIFE